MDKNAYLERNASQQPALELLQSMGYIYISLEDCALQRGSGYHVLLKDILRGQLRRLNRYAFAGTENEFSAANIERAMEDLDEPLTDGLVRTSEKIYVVMHEFCHFAYPNHSKHFYDFLTTLMPDWRERKKSLDKSAVYWI